MRSFLKSKIKLFVGLDIQPDEVRLLQLNSSRNHSSIEYFATKDLPSGTIVDGQINHLENLTLALSHLAKEIKLKRCEIRMAIPCQNIITTRIKLPASLTEKEREEEIRSNLTRFFSGIVADLSFDFTILGQDEDHHDILLVATKAQTLKDYLQVTQAAGFTINVVDSSVLAIMRAACFISIKQDIIAILNITSWVAQLMIIQGDMLLLHQQWIAQSLPDVMRQCKLAMQTWQRVNKENNLQACYLSCDRVELAQITMLFAPDYSFEDLTLTVFSKINLLSKQKEKYVLPQFNYKMITSLGLCL
jgi:Tfp pilus assembly PilM family ATPase